MSEMRFQSNFNVMWQIECDIRAHVLSNLLDKLGKEIKCEARIAFYLFSQTCLINPIKHEHSCEILYVYYKHVPSGLGK